MTSSLSPTASSDAADSTDTTDCSSDPMSLPPPLEGEFALALSGGGYRAAAYHLGVLDVLHRLGQLDEISTLSTISGGTILGACYALSRTRGESFETFYHRMYTTLRDVNVIERAFDRLDRATQNGTTAPSLIRAAADVYATEAFVGDARMGDLFPDVDEGAADARDGEGGGPLRELHRRVIFSATEFASGVAFRLQIGSETGDYFAGNGSYRVGAEVLRQVRLADAMAASSCFPSVFEPIRFPDDFDWGERTVEEIRAALPSSFSEPLPLMDGGTYDNQGIDGVRTTYRTAAAQRQFGWMMVSDSSPATFSPSRKKPADTPANDPTYAPILSSPVEPNRGGLKLGTLRTLTWIAGLVIALSAGSIAVDIVREMADGRWSGTGLLTEAVPFVLVVGSVAALWWMHRKYASLATYVNRLAGVNLSRALDPLSVDNAAVLVEERFASLDALASGVFMARIRGLVMKSLYRDPVMTAPPPGGEDRYYQRFDFNLLYATDGNHRKLYASYPFLEPTQEIRRQARRAASVETTLWFTEDREGWKKQDTVIATGQVTTCFVILRFLLRWAPDVANGSGSEREQQLYDRALALWEQAKTDPTSLLPDVNGGRGV